MQIPVFNDVKEAAERLKGQTYPTPLLNSPVIDHMCGMSAWIKPECSQKVGAFKYRGAFNRLSAMSSEERARGVVAYSSGNHAQGVSRAAKELGISAIIVMPSDAPKVKVTGVEKDGATIIFYDRKSENREDIAADISAREHRIIVPSFDDPYIIAGQGTTGIEIAEECQGSGINLDALITPIGGGGLCAGISLAMNALSPKTMIFGAEPANYNDHQQSIRSGTRQSLSAQPPTLCDALMTPMPGEITFPINSRSVSDVFTATDQDCLIAMAIAKRELGIVVEPGGAVALSAVLHGAFDNQDFQNICVVISGGNVDPEIMARAEKMLA